MRHRKKQEIDIPEGYVKGSGIDLSKWSTETLAVDMAGNVRCILGYRRDEQPHDLPYYSPLVALRDARGREARRFVELRHGALTMSRFLGSETYYRVLEDRYLLLPAATNSYFGVLATGTHDEDMDLTRSLFGGTYKEIEAVAIALGHITGRLYHETVRLPRLTFSKSRSNSCELTGCLIPKNFPYLAFEDSQYEWGHVSLFGFYRLLSFLCSRTRNNAVANALIEKGIPAETLSRFTGGTSLYSNPILYPDRY